MRDSAVWRSVWIVTSPVKIFARRSARANTRQEQDWLTRAQLAVSEVRSFREQDMLWFWPGVMRRWAIALIFALASAAAAGAGYAWWTEPYAAELNALRSRAEFADLVELRVLTMTPAERRQFDTLMKWRPSPH
jgi:hypothetical protein